MIFLREMHCEWVEENYLYRLSNLSSQTPPFCVQDLPVASSLLDFPSSPKYFELYTLLYSTTLSYIHNCVKLKSTLKSTKIKSDWGRGSLYKLLMSILARRMTNHAIAHDLLSPSRKAPVLVRAAMNMRSFYNTLLTMPVVNLVLCQLPGWTLRMPLEVSPTLLSLPP